VNEKALIALSLLAMTRGPSAWKDAAELIAKPAATGGLDSTGCWTMRSAPLPGLALSRRHFHGSLVRKD